MSVSELNDIISQLPPKGPSTYGRATPEAAHMLLAKLYLNAGVYTGTPNYAAAVTEAQAVIAGGYTLDPSFVHNFQADNNTSPELVFVAPQDGNKTQTWGGMTFLIHAGCGGSMSAANYGIDYCWGGYRMKQQIYRLFAAGDGAPRSSTRPARPIRCRIAVTLPRDRGAEVHQQDLRRREWCPARHGGHRLPDLPLADAYLIYAEANIRAGVGSATTALGYLNLLRSVPTEYDR